MDALRCKPDGALGCAIILTAAYILGFFQLSPSFALLPIGLGVMILSENRRIHKTNSFVRIRSGLASLVQSSRVLNIFSALYGHLFAATLTSHYLGNRWDNVVFVVPLIMGAWSIESAFIDAVVKRNKEPEISSDRDAESFDWASRLLGHALPFIEARLDAYAITTLHAAIDSSLPKDIGVSNVQISHLETGTVAPVISDVGVDTSGKAECVLYFQIAYTSNASLTCDFDVFISPAILRRFVINFRQLSLSLPVRLRIETLTETPYIGAIKMQALRTPDFDLSISIYPQYFPFDILSFPFLAPIFRRVVSDTLTHTLVSPLEVSICTIGTNKFESLSRTELYQVSITISSARDLLPSDIGNTSDPYCKISFDSHSFRTPIVKKTLNPIWRTENMFSFVTMGDTTSYIDFEIWDWDRIGHDEKIALHRCTMKSLLKRGMSGPSPSPSLNLSLSTSDGKLFAGILAVSLTVSSLSASADAAAEIAINASENISIEPDGRNSVEISTPTPVILSPLPPPLPVAAPAHLTLHICLIQAEDLIAADRNGLSDPYVVFSIGKQTCKSKVVKKTLNPMWDQGFKFEIRDPKSEELIGKVFDEDLFSKDDPLGHFRFPLSNISTQPTKYWIKLEGVPKGSVHLALALTQFEEK